MQDSVMNSRFEYVFIFSQNQNAKRKLESNYFRNISNVFELNPSGKNKIQKFMLRYIRLNL